MPLYKTITVDPNTRVFLWKIEESYETLYNGVVLTRDCKLRLAGMRSEIHRKGFLSIRHLLQAAGYDASDLYYDAFGKPYLRDGMHISITHSFIFSAIIISRELEVGIDVEMQRDVSREWVQSQDVTLVEATVAMARASSIPVIASGGITDIEDIRALSAVAAEGICGAITGRAIYEGTLDVAEAQQLCDEAAA